MTAVRLRRDPAQALLWLLAVAIVVFLTAPLVVVIPQSFNPSSIIQFPPPGFTLQWYEEFFADSFWLDALWLSVKLGAASALLSTVLALAAVLALQRFLNFGQRAMRMLVLLPLIVPVIVAAIAMFDVMIRLRLVGTFWGLLLSHTILALPFPFVILDNALRAIDASLEDAAVSLGASRLRALFIVTLPLMKSSLLGALLFAFIASWDEVVIALFVGGATAQTLPLKMFQFLTTEVRPTVGAVSALLVGVLLLVVLALRVAAMLKTSGRRVRS